MKGPLFVMWQTAAGGGPAHFARAAAGRLCVLRAAKNAAEQHRWAHKPGRAAARAERRRSVWHSRNSSLRA